MSKVRKKQKYPALDLKKNLKIRQELIDYDYINKLTNEEKEWLNKFTEEYVSASFEKDKSGRHHKSNLHKSSYRKDCYSRNNKRNNDIYGVAKINGMVTDDVILIDKSDKRNPKDTEDNLIAVLDSTEDERQS